jgi:DNA polymerase III epsilon subunit-like protein
MALFLDIETNGFPDNKGLAYGEYPMYNILDKYNNARIVQISAMLCNDKFEQITLIDLIIKTNGFTITNSNIHHITNEISEKSGITIHNAITDLYELIKQSSHIFAHNSNFDMNVLKSELYRAGLTNVIDEINKKSIVCTMKHTKNIVKICNSYGIKDPKLSELYTCVTRKPMIQQHNAKYDVIHLHEAIKKLFDDNRLNFTETIILNIVTEPTDNQEIEPKQEDYSKLKLAELQQKCKDLGLSGYSKLTKAKLIEKLIENK